MSGQRMIVKWKSREVEMIGVDGGWCREWRVDYVTITRKPKVTNNISARRICNLHFPFTFFFLFSQFVIFTLTLTFYFLQNFTAKVALHARFGPKTTTQNHLGVPL